MQKSILLVKVFCEPIFFKDGKEISEYFCGTYEWVNSPKIFIQGAKDISYIDAIETTEAYVINVNDLVYLFDNFLEMERITSVRFTSAKEKYHNLPKTCADIYHRSPLGIVASYMGITQETLSRIRTEK